MNSILQALVVNEKAVVGHSIDLSFRDKTNEVSTALNGEKATNDADMHEVPEKERSLTKTFAMLLAAPFIALAYIIALPFIGLYQLAKLAMEAYAKSHPVASGKLKKVAVSFRNIGLFFASPFIALTYIIALPFVGLFMFSKLAMEANAKRRNANS